MSARRMIACKVCVGVGVMILLVTVYEVAESLLWLLARVTEIFNLVTQRRISAIRFTNERL